MSFDAKDLVRVLKACRQAGVTELKIGDIAVKFGASEIPQTEKVRIEHQPLTESELETAVKKANISDNVADAEDRLDFMQIDNPSLYEQLVIERELEDHGTTENTEH